MHIEFVANLVETFEAIALMSLIIQKQFVKDIDSGQHHASLAPFIWNSRFMHWLAYGNVKNV